MCHWQLDFEDIKFQFHHLIRPEHIIILLVYFTNMSSSSSSDTDDTDDTNDVASQMIKDGAVDCAVNYLNAMKQDMVKVIELDCSIKRDAINHLNRISTHQVELCKAIGVRLFDLSNCDRSEIMVGLWYEAAVKYEMNESMNKLSIRLEEDLYKYLSPAVEKAWKRSSEGYSTCKMAVCAGKDLLGLTRKTMKKGEGGETSVHKKLPATYKDLCTLMDELVEYMKGNQNKNPKQKLVQDFLEKRNDVDNSATDTSNNNPPTHSAKRHCRRERIEGYIKGYESTTDERCPILKATSIAALKVHLTSARLDTNGDLFMSDEDQLKFINCPFVASIIFDKLTQ